LQKITYITIILAAVITGCSPSRKAARATGDSEKAALAGNSIETVVLNNLSNNSFYIQKADIRVIQDNISVRLIADIKFKRPDSMLITVRSRTGIEGGRAFITRDTLIIRDRINKKLMVGKPEILGTKYGIEKSFILSVLGDIVIEEKDRAVTMECIRGDFRKEYLVGGKNVEYIIDCQRKKLKQAYFEGDIKTGNITIAMSEIVNSGKVVYPGKIEINDDLKSMAIVLEIKKIESPWNGKMGSVSGQGYKVVKIR